MHIITDKIISPVNIHTDVQDGYLIEYLPEAEVYINGQKETSKPSSLLLSWSLDEEKRAAEQYTVSVSTSPDFSDAKIYHTEKTEIEITNLMLSTTYYWKVTGIVSNEKVESDIYVFTTSDFGPRFIDVDGVTNVRDIGGWPVMDGRKIKQGLLYRGSAPICDKRQITEHGLNTVRNELGIKTEIDLRIESDPTAPSFFGNDIGYKVVPMKEYSLDTAARNVCLFFRILADKTIYPAYMHCLAGSDRTGFLSFLLLSFLGVEEYSWLRDYSATNLSLCEFPRNRREIRKYAENLDCYPGNTLSEKTENYLLSIGLTKEELTTIKDIFI